MSAIHISIAAEPVFHLGHIAITNSILTSWVVSAFLIGLAIWAKNHIKHTKKPTGLQNFLEMVIEALHGLTQGITESNKKTKAIFPFVLSFFLFILLNNWIGLVPGVGSIGFTEHHGEESAFVPFFRAGTADLNTTLALALVSCVSTWTLGFKFLGLGGYLAKFKNPLELVSEFSRLISFTFRLFGNIFAGEVLLVVMAAIVPIIVPSVFYGLEIFVGMIQALVFSILTLVFMNLATEAHGGGDHHAQA